jgi:hypothetical protein
MLRDLAPLIAALAAAVLVYVARDRSRKRTWVRPARPDITIQEAWEVWRAGAPDDPGHPPALLDGEAGKVEREVAATAARAAKADHPRLYLRNAILHSAMMALHLEAIAALPEEERAVLLKGYTPGMDGLLEEARRAYRCHWMALRCYLRLKYDDAVADDWLHYYLHVAGPYIKEKVRLARDYLVQVDESAGRFAEVYDKLLDELRREMLKTPPKRRFPPTDLA